MKKLTETKVWLRAVMIVALIDMQIPFILAILGRETIAEDLGKVIAAEIIGVFLVYCCKSFFETRESENVRLREKEIETKNEYENEEVVG